MAYLVKHVHGRFKMFMCGVVVKKVFPLILIIFVPWFIFVQLILGIFKHICCY